MRHKVLSWECVGISSPNEANASETQVLPCLVRRGDGILESHIPEEDLRLVVLSVPSIPRIKSRTMKCRRSTMCRRVLHFKRHVRRRFA